MAYYTLTDRQRRYLGVKHTLDFFAALFLLILLIVPFIIIAAIQKILEPKEPVFFVQERIGQWGRMIRIVKFRTMKSTVDHYLSTNRALSHAQNMTKFGRFLRDTSVDELPQLLHVLTGQMSIIGPRPLIPQEETVHSLRHECGVYQLRPGLTGWAQINGRDYVIDGDKVKFDREYMEELSFSMDLKITLQTARLVFRRENIL